MIAAVYHAPGDVRVEDMPEPAEPRAADVVLEVARAAICGTDASEFAHAPKFFPIAAPHPFSGHQGPTIMGHEFTGPGRRARPRRRGPRASASASSAAPASRAAPASGACAAARTCAPATTRSACTATAASRVTCARRPRSAAPVPETCSDDAAAMAQPLAVALHALRRSGARPGQSIAVIGAGGIGSFLVGAAAASGAGDLIAVDVDDARLEARARAGRLAHRQRRRARTPSRRSAPSRARAPTSCSRPRGAPRSPGIAIAAAKRGGTVLIVGLQAEPVALDLFSAAIREVDIKTTLAHVCDEDLAAAVADARHDRVRPRRVRRADRLSEIVPRGLVPLAEGTAGGKLVVDVSA